MLAHLVNSIFGKDTQADTEPAPSDGGEDGTVLHATDENFRAVVLDSPVPVLVDYWAPWCGPCQAMGPVLDQLATEMGDRARVVKLNVDDNPGVSGRYGIRSIPTLMIFDGGKRKKTFTGLTSKGKLARALSRLAS